MEETKKLTADEARRKFLQGDLTPEELAGDVELLAGFMILMKEHFDSLKHQLSQLQRSVYGRKSERFKDPNQLLLFQSQLEELLGKAIDLDKQARAERKNASKPQAPAKGHGRKKLPESLPRFTERIEIPKEERTCPDCGKEMKPIGEEVTEKLCKISLTFVRRVERPVYTCQDCHTGVLTAEAPEEIVDRGMFDRSFLASLLVAKYKDHLPLYRQAEIYKRDGIQLSVSTLSDQVSLGADLLEPIWKRIHEEILKRPWIQADETPVRYVEGKGKGKKTVKSYIWAFRAGKGRVFYVWAPTRGGIVAKEVLDGYEGKLQTDEYSGYSPIYRQGKVVEVGCMAHARRYFEKALETSRIYAETALSFFRFLYEIEKKLPKGETEEEIEERGRIRREKALPVLEKFKEWIEVHQEVVLPKSPIGVAMKYMSERWGSFLEYTRDGRLEIDNNGVERKIRPFAVGRKNWLQFGSEEGGKRAAILMTLMENCHDIEVDPFLYLWDVLKRVGKCPSSKIHELTPLGWKEAYMDQAKEELSAWQTKVLGNLKV